MEQIGLHNGARQALATAIYECNDALFQWKNKAIEDGCSSPQMLKCWRQMVKRYVPVCLAAECSLKYILVG